MQNKEQKVDVSMPVPTDCKVLRGEELSPDQQRALQHLPPRHGVHIMPDRDLHSAVVMRCGRPVAAIWTSWRADRFTFDVIVEPELRGNGLAKRLVFDAVRDFNRERKAYKDPMMVIDVINPAMRRLLEEHFGFYVAFDKTAERWEMIPPTDDEGAVVFAGDRTLRKVYRENALKICVGQ